MSVIQLLLQMYIAMFTEEVRKAAKGAVLLVPDRYQDMCSTLVFLNYILFQILHTLANAHGLFHPICVLSW